MQEETLNFTLSLAEKSVVIDGEGYVLRELDGKERDTYLNDLSARTRIGANGKPAGVKDFVGLHAGLLAKALKKVVGNERQDIDKKAIQSWPASTVSKLFDIAKELSGLGNDEGDAVAWFVKLKPEVQQDIKKEHGGNKDDEAGND